MPKSPENQPELLLTSFTTWLPHQKSNASDDLLKEFPDRAWRLRLLPVDTDQASQRVIAAIQELKPGAVVCLGMAELRSRLNLELSARFCGDRLQTSLDLASLVRDLEYTEISTDAGQFVCEGLYYHVLQHLQRHHPHVPCVFVHVPVLRLAIKPKFWRILSECSIVCCPKLVIQANHEINSIDTRQSKLTTIAMVNSLLVISGDSGQL